MTDRQVIIEAMLKVLKESDLPRGLLWEPFERRTRDRTGCSREQFQEAYFAALDDCQLELREAGWVGVVEDPAARRKADDAALDRHEDARADREENDERRHDAGRQQGAEGR